MTIARKLLERSTDDEHYDDDGQFHATPGPQTRAGKAFGYLVLGLVTVWMAMWAAFAIIVLQGNDEETPEIRD